MPASLVHIVYRVGPIIEDGTRYVARLTGDRLEVDTTAPPAELIDAVWVAALRVARRGMMMVPVLGKISAAPGLR